MDAAQLASWREQSWAALSAAEGRPVSEHDPGRKRGGTGGSLGPPETLPGRLLSIPNAILTRLNPLAEKSLDRRHDRSTWPDGQRPNVPGAAQPTPALGTLPQLVELIEFLGGGTLKGGGHMLKAIFPLDVHKGGVRTRARGIRGIRGKR